MRKLKNEKKAKSFSEKNSEYVNSENKISKSLKIVLLLSWILPFIAVFIIHFSRMKLPEKTKEIVCKILNMNFSVMLVQFLLISILQPLAFAKAPAIIIYALMLMLVGLFAYWIISHIIGTIKFLKNEDYSYKFSKEIFKLY